MYQQLASSRFDSLVLSEKLTSGLETLGGDAATQRRNAIWLVRFALEFFRSAAMKLSDYTQGAVISTAVAFATRLRADSPEDHEFVISLFERVADTEKQINMNVAVPRCLEALCDDLGRKLRRREAWESGVFFRSAPQTSAQS